MCAQVARGGEERRGRGLRPPPPPHPTPGCRTPTLRPWAQRSRSTHWFSGVRVPGLGAPMALSALDLSVTVLTPPAPLSPCGLWSRCRGSRFCSPLPSLAAFHSGSVGWQPAAWSANSARGTGLLAELRRVCSLWGEAWWTRSHAESSG